MSIDVLRPELILKPWMVCENDEREKKGKILSLSSTLNFNVDTDI